MIQNTCTTLVLGNGVHLIALILVAPIGQPLLKSSGHLRKDFFATGLDMRDVLNFCKTAL